MSITIKSTGLIGLYRDGVLISEHNAEVIVSLLQKTVIPFSWGQPTLGFSQGTAGSVDLAVFLVNPEGRSIVYSVVGALPSGVTLNGSTLAYNGSGPVASNTVSLVASSGGFESTSSPVTVTIVLGNVAPQFTVAPATSSLPASGGMIQFTAVDPNGDAVSYSLTTTRSGITINASGLVTVTGTAAGTSGAIVVRAADPQGAFTQASCAVTVAGGSQLKFNPGHYVIMYSWSQGEALQADRFAFYDTLENETHVKGVVLTDCFWGMWESSQGNYTAGIARLQAEVNYLAAMGKRLIIRLRPGCRFSVPEQKAYVGQGGADMPGSHLVPSYMHNSTYAGGFVHNGTQWQPTHHWNDAARARFVALIQAYGAAFDSNPWVEMFICDLESSYSWDTAGGYPPPSGFSNDKRADHYLQLISDLRAAWPTTMVRTSVSWMDPKDKLKQYVAKLATVRGCGGSEDVLLDAGTMYPGHTGQHDTPSWAAKEYMGQAWPPSGANESSMNDRRGIISHCDLNEGPVYCGKEGNWLPSEIFAQANRQRQTHMLWIKMYYVGAAAPWGARGARTDMTLEQYKQSIRWLGSYGGQAVGILPFIRTNPAWTQTTAPTSLLPVITGGS